MATETKTFTVTGMHCANCGLLVDEVLSDIAGVESSATDVDKSTTVVQFDPSAATTDDIVAAIRGAGYEAQAAGARASAG